MGAPPDWVIGIIAGGDSAIRQPVENAEGSETQAWSDLSVWQIDTQENKMVDMLLSNAELLDRGVQMVMQATGVEYNEATRCVRPSKNYAGSVCLQGDKHTKSFEHVRAFDGTPKLGTRRTSFL
jgi:N-acetylmuramic acid 6-phosphate (MurNAc-6-P) etherase